MSVTAAVSDVALAARVKFRGKRVQMKVKSYWSGNAPEWADDSDEDGDIKMTSADALDKVFPTLEDSNVFRKDDPSLRHPADSKIANGDEVRADDWHIRQAEIISTEE